ncbi:Fc.00g028830.m01.CDS01 [Cosmosporella sp. VM-42]
MAATTAQPPSKSSKKKAAKAIERTESPAPSATSTAAEKAGDDSFESPYIKELQKNIRNVNKKITNASKTDSLLSQHAGKSLEDLVAAKIINPDQKAQILKKPALQAQLAQFEEQLVQYQKVDEQYRTRAAADKAEWEKGLEKAKADAVSESKEGLQKTLRENLLLLSQFLRLAAYRREEGQEPESDESQAIEGVLLAIYTGDEGAVNSMLKLMEGSEDKIVSVPGEQLQTTYSQVKALAQEPKAPLYTEGTQSTEQEPAQEVASDPTLATATAAEIEAEAAPLVNGPAAEPAQNGLANANVSDEAANAVAESHWDNGTNNELSMSQEWVDVKVPRDASETETGLKATPAAATNTQSWADDHPEPIPEPAVPAAADPNDGFHQVQRNRGRNEREGGSHRGRGRGEWRGRGGFRGEGRGRGRGGRGGSGAPRGRRNEES